MTRLDIGESSIIKHVSALVLIWTRKGAIYSNSPSCWKFLYCIYLYIFAIYSSPMLFSFLYQGGNPSSLQEPTWTLAHSPETLGASAAETETPLCLLYHRTSRFTYFHNQSIEFRGKQLNECFMAVITHYLPFFYEKAAIPKYHLFFFRRVQSHLTEPCCSMWATRKLWRTWTGTVWSSTM